MANFSVSRLLSAISALGLAASLVGCDGQVPAAATSQELVSCPALPDVLLSSHFNLGLAGWALSTSQPTDIGHNWTLVEESGAFVLRSDPAGATKPGNYENRIDSPTFEPYGRKNLRVKIRARFNVAAHGIFQVFAASAPQGGNIRSLIGDFNGQNPSWPAADEFVLNLPAELASQDALYVSLLVQSAQGGDFGAVVEKLEVLGDPADSGQILKDDFSMGLAKWEVYSDPAAPGHVWEPVAKASCGSNARSDSAGQTLASNYTRLESLPFSLVGKQKAQLAVQASYSLPSCGRYQVFVADMESDSHRSLIGEFSGANANYPAADTQLFQIPADFVGLAKVRVAFLELTGSCADTSFGIALDQVQVLAK